ncbi:DHA1 family bicyclomycin/chloramphenicol resistance-like MFS transporter [Mesorhizobium sp. J18]|uniref:multidrug effflux MFS transporter n=1 Tax=Mesorhizobium sp. J18 TaxID=935263 RepID=UPI0011999538|nr:multidrug effflux MFS transporter [Mesorhizobium sp. J18]TWH01260.1 DHA1 family bicyclomycin/chloramphenicol resistance-like MFS transporter [Mesorhizobium sp. J18]
MTVRRPDRTTPPHILTLVTATATGAVAMNVFLPSLPGMARHFEADYGVVQLAVSLYLAAMAVLQLGIGPASDRFGRRPVMLVSFAIFILSTAAAVAAPTIEFLLGCRILQAFAASGMVLSRAIVRDTVGPDEAASRIGYITMGMALAPMIGPVIGGVLDELYGWQATFMLMLAFGLIAFAVVFFDLGETNMAASSSIAEQMGNYPQLFGSRRFWGYTATAAFTSGSFFAFLGGGPYVATEILHLSPSGYGLYFVLLSVGYMLGNYASARHSRTVGINRMMLLGNVISTVGVLLSMSLFAAGYFHALALFGPIFFVGVGNGVTMPNANAGIVSVRPHLAGSASGLGGALQIGGGAALSVAAGALLSQESGPSPLLWVMLVSSLAAVAATFYVMHVAREAGDL